VRCGLIGNASGCPRRSLPSCGRGAAPSRPLGATYAGCHRQVMSTAAIVASCGVLMLSRASARVRLAGSSTPLVAVRDCRPACCALSRTPAVEGLTVHITPDRAGNSRGAGSTIVVTAEGPPCR